MNNLFITTSTNQYAYSLDNSGKTDVSETLQDIFNNLYETEQTNVTMKFSSGIYFIDKPLFLKFCGVNISGESHGGIDIHGMNLATGTIFYFGKNCAPNCMSFDTCKQDKTFPAGKLDWDFETSRVHIEHINFVGYNNTDVDTANGYSRFTGDNPNFRGLFWYPTKERYENPETDGQRAIVILKNEAGQKSEMLSLQSCYFTDLFMGIEVFNCDVSNIRDCWFAQMVNGIVYHSYGQCIMMQGNCFADLETAVNLTNPVMSTLHNNTFAYVSKCFVIDSGNEININSNVVKNWAMATGTAPCGAFLYAERCKNINVNANTVNHAIDSRVKTRTIDNKPNGRSFIHFNKCRNVMMQGNLLDTMQTQTVICIEDTNDAMINNNLIIHNSGGNECAIKGNSNNIMAEGLSPYKY